MLQARLLDDATPGVNSLSDTGPQQAGVPREVSPNRHTRQAHTRKTYS